MQLTGKQILLDALRCRPTPRPAWVPFVGVHGGRLLGETAETYLKSSRSLVDGLLRAIALYKPDGLPIVFDLQMEAEVLGCDLQWSADSPPAVISHPLEAGPSPEGLPADLDLTAGRFPLVADALERMKELVGDTVALYGLITGPFTLALHLRGHDIFLDMFEREEATVELLDYCSRISVKAANFYIDHGADVVAVVDPMTSQISPQHFAQFVAAPVDAVFDHIRFRGTLSSLFVCGNATRNLEAMCQTGCDNISIDENIDLAYIRDLATDAGKSFGGNLKLTQALLLGSPEDVERDTLRCLDLGKDVDGFILAPGCDLAYDTPEQNLRAVASMVHDEYHREVVRRKMGAAGQDSFDDVEVPDYGNTNQVIIDVVTLNSSTCAPCQYMMAAARKAAEAAGCPVHVQEHKITNRNGLGHMAKLGVRAIPTICIQGEPLYSSIIPDRDTLIESIQSAWRGMQK